MPSCFKSILANLANPNPLETEPDTSMESSQPVVDEYVYLIGRPTLRQFLSFVRHRTPNGRFADLGAATDEWRAAATHIARLEGTDAGLSGRPQIEKLPPHLESLGEEFVRDPLVQHGFNLVPAQVGIVNLDHLVVYQHHIDLSHVAELKKKLGPSPNEETIFRFCLRFDHPRPPAQWARARRDTYVFSSPSNDLRFLAVMPLDAGHVTGYPPPGALVGVVGLAVGFSANFLSVINAFGRLILHNGSHRAFALRELGINQAPCVIQHVYSREELNVVASDAVAERPDVFVGHKRPPMLKDYFDPKLRQILPVIRRLRQVTLKFQVEESYVPAVWSSVPPGAQSKGF